MGLDIKSTQRSDGQCAYCMKRPVPVVILADPAGARLFRGSLPDLTFCIDCAKLVHRELTEFVSEKKQSPTSKPKATECTHEFQDAPFELRVQMRVPPLHAPNTPIPPTGVDAMIQAKICIRCGALRAIMEPMPKQS